MYTYEGNDECTGSIISASLLAICLVLCVITFAVITLMMTKRNVKKEFSQKVYEETGCQQIPPAAVDVNVNIAYGQIK